MSDAGSDADTKTSQMALVAAACVDVCPGSMMKIYYNCFAHCFSTGTPPLSSKGWPQPCVKLVAFRFAFRKLIFAFLATHTEDYCPGDEGGVYNVYILLHGGYTE